MTLTFIGTRGEIDARTRRHRMHTSLLVSYHGARVMIDCGLDWLGKLERVDPSAIVLTHAHPDHAWGLKQGGFQTRRDVRNFLQCVRRVMPDAKVLSRSETHVIRFEKRKICVGHFPIGIDFDSFDNAAKSEVVAQRSQQLRASFPDCQLMLGSDRSDYSKGIPERLRAFRDAIERYPEMRGRVVLIAAPQPRTSER